MKKKDTKTLKIDFSRDRILDTVIDFMDERDYVNVLKMLNKNAEFHGNDADTYVFYAQTYEEMGLFESSINYWYKAMCCLPEDELVDAYEGLATTYMNIGMPEIAATYYKLFLKNSDDLDVYARMEIMDNFLGMEKNPLKFVYPPAIADVTDIISDAITAMKTGDYEKARELFDSIDEGHANYAAARTYIAMCYIFEDKLDEAERECLSVLEKFPNFVQASTTLAAVKTEKKEYDKSRALAHKLLKLNTDESDDLYKIATVCCENKMHEEAFELFNRLEKSEMCFDHSILYFKAVSAYNSGKYNESFSAFLKLLTIYPNAVTARLVYEKARESYERGEIKELSYFYQIPKEDRKNTLKVLAAISRLSARKIKNMLDYVDISQCIYWCFDECGDVPNPELQSLAAACAVKAELYEIVENILMNAFVSDSLKMEIMIMLGERNTAGRYSLVFYHNYKEIEFRALNLGRAKRKIFISAYATLTAHFCVLDPSLSERFAKTCEELYRRLEKEKKLNAIDDVRALSAAIYYKSNVENNDITRGNLTSFFEVSEEKISEILGGF